MPDTNPDSEMMRGQQDLDTDAKLAPDESRAKKGPSDTDAISQHDREKTAAGHAPSDETHMDALFDENRDADADPVEAGRKPEKGESLASPGRSILGN